MNARGVFIVGCFIAWSMASWWWYVCQVKALCGESATPEWLADILASAAPPTSYRIAEHNGEIIIYFPSDASRLEVDQRLNEYFDKLARRVRDDQRTLEITGHTDSQGGVDRNYKLGLKRAEALKQLLLNRGIQNERIMIYSKGESEPRASNDSEGGRSQNRRVEIVLH